MTVTCVAAGNIIWWTSDEGQLDNSQNVDIVTVLVNEAENIRMSNLTIWVSSPENATNVTCHASAVALSGITFANSQPGKLLVQGRYYYCILL